MSEAEAIYGAGALAQMLDLIGTIEAHNDKAVVSVLVENEMSLRALLRFALGAMSDAR